MGGKWHTTITTMKLIPQENPLVLSSLFPFLTNYSSTGSIRITSTLRYQIIHAPTKLFIINTRPLNDIGHPRQKQRVALDLEAIQKATNLVY